MQSKFWFRALLVVLILASTVNPAFGAPKYTVMHGFTGGKDGGGVWGSLTLDGKGNAYGVTVTTVFELKPHTDGKWGLKVLHRFGNEGGGNGGLIFDSTGNLYGGTPVGGPYGKGTVFELSPHTHGWEEEVLNDFPPGEHAGGPHDRLVMDKAGNLYGTAGSAYELSRTGTGWEFANLHEFPSFNGDGVDPYAGLVMAPSGNLYGTTAHGGGSSRCGDGCGTVYELSPVGGGKWKETLLHQFQAYADGSYPSLGALALDDAGNLYGTADGGNSGKGVIFRMSRRDNGSWKETVLYNILGGADGDHPGASVVMDKTGNLYGTTIAGGSGCDCGVVYKLAPQKNGKWKYTVLHTFVGSDGAQPDANLILDDKGNLYGTTATGGPGGYGVAFELTP